MYFLHRVEIDPYRRRAAQPRSPARENFRRRVNHAFCSGIPLQRDTHTLRRLSHPACASAGIPVLFRLPHPARASAGIPILFCRQPPPRPRLRQRILRHFFGLLHPARAAGAGSVPGRISGEQPCPALLRDLPVHWTVEDIAIGGGADGEGELVPPPLFLTLQPSCFPSIPPQPLAGDSYTSPATPPPAPPQGYPDTSPAPPTPPAPAALLPRPRLGAGSVPGSSPGSPRALDRGGHRYWERRPAGRRRSPPPCLSRPQDPAHRADPACLSAGGNPDFFPPSPPGACP